MVRLSNNFIGKFNMTLPWCADISACKRETVQQFSGKIIVATNLTQAEEALVF